MGRAVIALLVFALVAVACKESGASGNLNCRALTDGLDSYRYESDVMLIAEGSGEQDGEEAVPAINTRIRVSGEVVTPDREKAVTRYSGDLETDPVNQLVIGDTSWILVGDRWQPSDLTPDQTSPISFQPAEFCQAAEPDADLTDLEGAIGRVGVIAAERYHIEGIESDFIARLPSRAGGDDAVYARNVTIDVWLTEDKWPARLEVHGSGTYPDGREITATFITQVSDPDDDTIEIEPPEES